MEDSIKILHISDIHAGSNNYNICTYQYSDMLLKTLDEKKIDFLICSGDLIFQGKSEYYKQVVNFFEKIKKSSVKIIFVPGNHDICLNEKLFTSFDIFANKISKMVNYRFSEANCLVYPTDSIDFYLVNSAYTGNHEYGKIDYIDLESTINKQQSTNKLKILITHHPFLAEIDDKRSSTRNARKILELLAKNKFTAVLHGHQHMNTYFGYKFSDHIVDVIGVRSLTLPSIDIPIGAQLIFVSNSIIQEITQLDLSQDKDIIYDQ